MSDFWQAAGNLPIINLEHVISIDRPKPGGDLRVLTALPGVTFNIKAGSEDELSLLSAIGQRIGRKAPGTP